MTSKLTALISVYDKTGIVGFAKALIALGYDIIGSKGTVAHLEDAGVPATDVSLFVGGDPILGHKVVTLSREIHAGLLADYDGKDRLEMGDLGIPYIDLLYNTMYPLQETIEKHGDDMEAVRQQTDVGGPAMVHAAVKGRRIVVCDLADCQRVVDWLKDDKPNEQKFIMELAAKAEGYCAKYLLDSARYLSNGDIDGMIGTKHWDCRYGENGYQNAAVFTTHTGDPLGIDGFERVDGADPSTTNVTDFDRMLTTITHIAASFEVNFNEVPAIAVGVKHGNPCGAGVGKSPKVALQRMLMGDPLAIFGGFLVVNFEIGAEEADILINWEKGSAPRRLIDGIVAPSYSEEAVTLLKREKGACKIFKNDALLTLTHESLDPGKLYRRIRGGFIRQTNYDFIFDFEHPDLKWYGSHEINREEVLIARAICETSNSNTITLVNGSMLIGNGVGQQDRVFAAKQATSRAIRSNHHIESSTAASDSFFPFADGPQALVDAGVEVIVTTSGSKNDSDVIDLCRDHDITLIMIPDSIARGFFGH